MIEQDSENYNRINFLFIFFNKKISVINNNYIYFGFNLNIFNSRYIIIINNNKHCVILLLNYNINIITNNIYHLLN